MVAEFTGVRTDCRNVLNQLARGNADLISASTTGTLADFLNILGTIPGYVTRSRYVDGSSHKRPDRSNDPDRGDVVVINTDEERPGHWEYWEEYIGESGSPFGPDPQSTQNPYQQEPDRTKDVATFNCVGLACRTYEYQGDLNQYLEFLRRGRRLTRSSENCKPNELKFWLWTYDLSLVDEDGNQLSSPSRDFHTVAGQMDRNGKDPTNVYSKNGRRPIHGPSTGPTFKPPDRERATANTPTENLINTSDGRPVYKTRTNRQLG